jgi:hypothetical protein
MANPSPHEIPCSAVKIQGKLAIQARFGDLSGRYAIGK